MCLQLNLCVLCVSRIVEQASGEFVIEHATNRRVNRSHVDQTAPHRLSKRACPSSAAQRISSVCARCADNVGLAIARAVTRSSSVCARDSPKQGSTCATSTPADKAFAAASAGSVATRKLSSCATSAVSDRMYARGLRKTPLFSQLFLCLSRACLGKMIVYM